MMNLEHRKLNFIESFIHINDVDVIEKLEKIIKIDFNKNKTEEMKPMSLESFYEMIDLSLAQAESGDVYTSQEIDDLIESWK